MINKIWAFMIVISILFFLVTFNLDTLNKEILSSGEVTLGLIMTLVPIMGIWSGIMNIASKSGLLNICALKLSPVLSKLFPEIPKGHESLSYIASNIIINMVGMGSSATVFGLKAMKSLDELNNHAKVASRSMITFIILNTSGVTLIPTTIIALRQNYGSKNPVETVFVTIIVTTIISIVALIIDRLHYKKGRS